MSDESVENGRKPIDVYVFLGVMLEQISSIAWQKLGLQPDIITGKLEPDLVQAKTAIDVTAELAKAIENLKNVISPKKSYIDPTPMGGGDKPTPKGNEGLGKTLYERVMGKK